VCTRQARKLRRTQIWEHIHCCDHVLPLPSLCTHTRSGGAGRAMTPSDLMNASRVYRMRAWSRKHVWVTCAITHATRACGGIHAGTSACTRLDVWARTTFETATGNARSMIAVNIAAADVGHGRWRVSAPSNPSLFVSSLTQHPAPDLAVQIRSESVHCSSIYVHIYLYTYHAHERAEWTIDNHAF